MNIIQNSTLPRVAMPGLENITLAGSANGLKHLSVWRNTIAPGGATPPHRHDCEEVVLIHAGEGELHLDGVVHPFTADMTLVLPPNVPHQIVSTGTVPLELTGIFSVSPVPVFFPDGQPIELPWET